MKAILIILIGGNAGFQIEQIPIADLELCREQREVVREAFVDTIHRPGGDRSYAESLVDRIQLVCIEVDD